MNRSGKKGNRGGHPYSLQTDSAKLKRISCSLLSENKGVDGARQHVSVGALHSEVVSGALHDRKLD